MFFEKMDSQQAKNLSPLVLSFVGDAVHTMYTREKIVHNSDAKAHTLHLEASKIVKATAQSAFVAEILPVLNEEEMIIYKRGRNAKQHTMAKNAGVEEYKRASGFEALIGYLYLIGDENRLREILGANNED